MRPRIDKGAASRHVRIPGMYHVRCMMRSRFGEKFHWDFAEPTDDHQVAIHHALKTFLSGLTEEEKEDARTTLDVMAHPSFLPPEPLPIR